MNSMIESLSKMNLDIKKCIHHFKLYDIPSQEIANDIKYTVIENFKVNNDLIVSLDINNQYEQMITDINKITDDTAIDVMESLICKIDDIKQTCVESLNISEMTDYMGLLFNTYYTIENLIYESYKTIYDTETNYIESLLEDIVTEAENVGGTVVKTTAKAGKAVVKTASKMWETLLNFLKNMRGMFMSKHKKITERDAQWLKDNQKALLNINTNNIEINIHSDYKRGMNQARNTYNNFKNIVNSNVHNNKSYDDFKRKVSRFSNNGDLKSGLYNLYRTGNVANEYSIQTIRGNAVSGTISPLIGFCNTYIQSVSEITKELNQSEQFIKQLQREVKNRGLAVNEAYCYVEECMYDETELGLIFDFSYVTEAEGTGATTINNNNNTNTNNTNNNAGKKEMKDDKVGVTQRNETKETTDKMSDSQLGMYNKICRDKHLGISTYLTAMEKKYFESITILRGILKNKE